MPMASSVTNAPISMSPINFNLPGSVSGSLTRPTIVSSASLLNHGKYVFYSMVRSILVR